MDTPPCNSNVGKQIKLIYNPDIYNAGLLCQKSEYKEKTWDVGRKECMPL